MAITVGAIAAAMVGVAGTKDAPSTKGLARSTDVVAMIMLVMAAAIAGYALLLYLQRERQLQHHTDEETFNIDDRGTRVIVGIITASLSAIFIISLIDFFMCL
jgi:NADH:ubiquinone oxidoreductase subunit 5 (subunit L)/multisubunit Na+/H+ antiporter MnhA subunit